MSPPSKMALPVFLPFLCCVACSAGASTTDDSALDVGELLCAGLSDPSGETIVPTRSTDGCNGGNVNLSLYCMDCEFELGAALSLVAFGADGETATCATKEVSQAAGAARFEDVAPFGTYGLAFEGTISPETNLQLDEVRFTVCSDSVDVVGVVYNAP